MIKSGSKLYEYYNSHPVVTSTKIIAIIFGENLFLRSGNSDSL
jgi:hypothetical protein